MPKVAKPRRHGNRWQINWTDGTGKRRYKTYPRYQDAAEALRKHQTEADSVRAGRANPIRTGMTFAELADEWLKAKAHKRSLRQDRSRLNNHLRPAFARLPLEDITPARIDRFRRDLTDRVSRNTTRLILALLRSMLRLAERRAWLRRAPIIELPKPVDMPYDWIETPREVTKLLKAAQEEGYPGLMEFYATAVYTGLRAGELCGLCWPDLSFDRRLITVQRSYNRPTKSNKVRHVPILDPLLPVLRKWHAEGYDARVVFPNRQGNMHAPSARVLNRIFHRCLARAGISRVTFHALRHTFASHWVLNGGDLYRLQRILGHASIDTTQRYAHLAPHAFSQDWGRLGSSSAVGT